jgi:hypothetical protein
LTDVNGVWAVINKAISGEANVSASTVTYNVANIRTAEGVGYAPLKFVDGNGNVVATSVANEYGNGQFQNVPAGEYTVETSIGTLTINGQPATVVLNGEDISIAFDLTTVPNTLVQGAIFNYYIPDNATSVEFIAMPQTYGLADRTLPADAVDVSEAADGSVMAWMEDTTFYVVAMDGGVIYANPDSTYMFAQKSNLTFIGTDNLNTANITNAVSMFEGCSSLDFDMSELNFANVKNNAFMFYNCNSLSSIVIHEGTTIINHDMFLQCYNLTSIHIPASVERIDIQAFMNCKNLATITFATESNLEYIGMSAFRGCNFTSITLPASVNEIDGSCFLDCFDIVEINVDPANEHFCSVDGVLFSKDMKMLIAHPHNKTNTTYEIPASVEIIDLMAFYANDKLTSVTFAEDSQLKIINGSAFEGCSNLTSITLPEGVKEIGTEAFAGTDLNSVYIPASVEVIRNDAFRGTPWLIDKIDNEGIVYVNGILVDASAASGHFAFPEGTTEIPDDMFSNNHNLTSVYIPASVTKIGQNAFSHCYSLTSVTFAENSQLEEIGFYAFMDCPALTTITIPGSVKIINEDTFSGSGLTSVVISEGVEVIGNYAFYGCSGLTEVNIPASVNSIGGMVFTGCSNLTAINVDAENEFFVSIDGVLYTKTLKTLVSYPAAKTDIVYIAPAELEMIYYSAFDANQYIEEITLPARIDTICSGTFDYCSNLKTINFCGTQAQWNQIYFTGSWCNGVHPEFKIVYDYVIE